MVKEEPEEAHGLGPVSAEAEAGPADANTDMAGEVTGLGSGAAEVGDDGWGLGGAAGLGSTAGLGLGSAAPDLGTDPGMTPGGLGSLAGLVGTSVVKAEPTKVRFAGVLKLLFKLIVDFGI